MKKRKCTYLLIVIFATVLIMSILNSTYIVLEDLKTKQVVLLFHKNISNFSMKWIHSVELEEWEEFFEIDYLNRIILSKTKFKAFGAGVPDYAGKKTTVENGFIEFSEIDKVMGALNYGISPLAKHTFIYDNIEYPLYKILPDDIGVEIKVVKLNVFQQLIYRNKIAN